MAEQEFVIVPPSDTDVSAMALRTDVQFLDPYGSESINRKFFGIIPPGIYRGFKYALPGAMKLRIGLPNEPGTAVAQCNSVCITVQQTKPVDLTVAAGFSGLVVLTGFYQFGVPTKQVSTTSTKDAAKIELIAASALKPNQVILYTVNVPAGTTALTAAMISPARRQDVSIAVESDIYQLLRDHIASPTAHTKAQVGLGNVNNWGATSAVNDASNAKYATAGAVKVAYDLAAAALPKAGGTVGRIKIQATATHLTLAGDNGENPWHFEINGATKGLRLVQSGVKDHFNILPGGDAAFGSNLTSARAYVTAAQSTAANALTRRDFVLKWSEDNSRLDALKQAGVYIGGSTKTDFDQLDVGAHGLYSSGPDGDKSVNRPPAEAWGGSWVGLQSQRTFNSDMLQTTLPFGDAKTISFRTRRTNTFGEWISLYSTAFKPTKADVGLPLVNNWGATSAINDPSGAKYATAGAVKTAYDFAAKLKSDLGYQVNTQYRITINRPDELYSPYFTMNKETLRVGQSAEYTVGAFNFKAGPLADPLNPDSGKTVGSFIGSLDKDNSFGILSLRTKNFATGADQSIFYIHKDGFRFRNAGKDITLNGGELREQGERVFSPNNKPNKTDIGLPLVNNWGATAAVNDVSDVKYATAGAVKKAFDLAAAALPGSGGVLAGGLTIDSDKGLVVQSGGYGQRLVSSGGVVYFQGGKTDSDATEQKMAISGWYGKELTELRFHVATGVSPVIRSGNSVYKFYTEGNKPTKADVGLPQVNNWGATAAINDASDTKYATAGAVKKAYDLAATKLAANANAVSASKWATARTITLTGGATGSVSIDGSANVNMAVTVLPTAHTHTPAQVGLGSVNNWGATSAVNDPSNVKYATAGAVKLAYDLAAAALPRSGGALSGDLIMGSNGIIGARNRTILRDFGNGNVVISAGAKEDTGLPGDLYLGYNAGSTHVTNTVRLESKLTWKAVRELVDVDGMINPNAIKDGVRPGSWMPTKADIGLGSVNNWGATAAVNDASDVKYATAGAVKKAYDLAAAALPKSGGDLIGKVKINVNGAMGTGNYGLDMMNGAIGGLNQLAFADPCDATGEGIYFPKTGKLGTSTVGADYDVFKVLDGNAYLNSSLFYTESNKPTKADVGLPQVNNWGATAAINDASDTKYATAGAVKKAYDLAATKLAANANAVSASKWATARTITLTGGATGSVSIDGSANVNMAVTVLPTAHTHTPAQVGLGSVNNWGATAAVNDASDVKYATAGAVKKAYDLAASKANVNHGHPGSLLNPFTLSKEDLNTIVAPGVYAQNANLNTSAAQNYPENNAGTLTVTVAAGPQQRYHVYNSSRVYTRAQYATGGFMPWAREYNTMNKPTAADVGLGLVVNKGWNAGPVADTYAVRDSAGDLQTRLFRSSYPDESNFRGSIAFRVSGGADNFIRYCNSPASVRNWLNNGVTPWNIAFRAQISDPLNPMTEYHIPGKVAVITYIDSTGTYRISSSNGAGGETSNRLRVDPSGNVLATGGVFDAGQRVYSPNNPPHNTHNHTAAQGNQDIVAGGWGQVGTYMFAAVIPGHAAAMNPSAVIAGSSLRPGNCSEWGQNRGLALPGTWKCLGFVSDNDDDRWDDRTTLFIRIA